MKGTITAKLYGVTIVLVCIACTPDPNVPQNGVVLNHPHRANYLGTTQDTSIFNAVFTSGCHSAHTTDVTHASYVASAIAAAKSAWTGAQTDADDSSYTVVTFDGGGCGGDNIVVQFAAGTDSLATSFCTYTTYNAPGGDSALVNIQKYSDCGGGNYVSVDRAHLAGALTHEFGFALGMQGYPWDGSATDRCPMNPAADTFNVVICKHEIEAVRYFWGLRSIYPNIEADLVYPAITALSVSSSSGSMKVGDTITVSIDTLYAWLDGTGSHAEVGGVGGAPTSGGDSFQFLWNGSYSWTGPTYSFTPTTSGWTTVRARLVSKTGWVGEDDFMISKQIYVNPGPPTIHDFLVLSCEAGPKANNTWGFYLTTYGATNGLSWEVSETANSTDDPSAGAVVASGTVSGDNWSTVEEVALPGSGSTNNVYFWLRLSGGSYDTGWYMSGVVDISRCSL